MFLITVFICFCIASVVNFFKTRKQRSFITNLKGPFQFPLVGSLHKLIFLTPKNFQKKSLEYVSEYGGFSRCWVFHRLFIPMTDYGVVEQLLMSSSHLNTGNNLLRPWLGEGLLMCDGEKWNQRRQLLSHGAFNGAALNDFVEVFDDHAGVLVTRFREVSDGQQTFDIEPFVSKAILDTMIASTLGIKESSHYDIENEYAKSISQLTSLYTGRYLRLSSANSVTYAIMCPLERRRQKRLVKKINDFNMEVMNERCNSPPYQVEKPNTLETTIYTIRISSLEQSPAAVRHINLLDVLLTAQIDNVPLEKTEICDELNTFLFKGYLLTTSALNFTLVMLARHPAVQEKAFSEIRHVYPNLEGKKFITLSSLDRLKYLESLIMETLRLHPPLPIIGRELKEPFEYTHTTIGKGILPTGSEIYINIFEMLRDEEKFPEPNRFNPERFSQSTSEANGLLYYSLGPRDCIARKFAFLLLKTMLVNILGAYEILPFGDEVHLEFKISLRSSNGFQVGLQPRQDKSIESKDF